MSTSESEFKRELDGFLSSMFWLQNIAGMLPTDIDRRDVVRISTTTNAALRYLENMFAFLLKYNEFFQILANKFGVDVKVCETAKQNIVRLKSDFTQILMNISQTRFDLSKNILEEVNKDLYELGSCVSTISTYPYKIDYSKLTNSDWRVIAIPGIHYRSKVFLSYPFRDAAPQKDENQKMIDYYIKPLLKLLNIEPVTARDYLKPQELIDDKILALVKECDGIIGFYTRDDEISNVEHELSGDISVIAICVEEGAKSPLMRRPRLMINFDRQAYMANLVLNLIDALKERKMFELVS